MRAKRARRGTPRRRSGTRSVPTRAGESRGAGAPRGRAVAVGRSRAQGYCGGMPDKIRVACVQMTSRADKAANLETAERLVAQGAATGADVVVLPEKWNAIGDAAVYHATAEPLESGESVAAMSGWARAHGITLVGGSIAERREGREKLSNTCLVFDPEGQLVATYRKIPLFDVEVAGVVSPDSAADEAGDQPVVAELEDCTI